MIRTGQWGKLQCLSARLGLLRALSCCGGRASTTAAGWIPEDPSQRTQDMHHETLIIGGGISGLYAATLLLERGSSCLLLEARPHLGGRVRTELCDGHPLDLGPSWFWPDLNPRLSTLVDKLGLSHYPQFLEGDALLEDQDGEVSADAPLCG